MLFPGYTAEYQRNVNGSSKRYPSRSSRSRYHIQGTLYYLSFFFFFGKTLRACSSGKSNVVWIICILNGPFVYDIDYKVARILEIIEIICKSCIGNLLESRLLMVTRACWSLKRKNLKINFILVYTRKLLLIKIVNKNCFKRTIL